MHCCPYTWKRHCVREIDSGISCYTPSTTKCEPSCLKSYRSTNRQAGCRFSSARHAGKGSRFLVGACDSAVMSVVVRNKMRNDESGDGHTKTTCQRDANTVVSRWLINGFVPFTVVTNAAKQRIASDWPSNIFAPYRER